MSGETRADRESPPLTPLIAVSLMPSEGTIFNRGSGSSSSHWTGPKDPLSAVPERIAGWELLLHRQTSARVRSNRMKAVGLSQCVAGFGFAANC